MTREEAIDIFEDNFTVLNTHSHYTEEEEAEAITMAIEALEQEPVLGKIRAEIEDLTYYCCEVHPRYVIDDVLEIIDKYKADMRGGECVD